MIVYPFGALVTGIAFALAAIAIIIRHYLLDKSKNYPSAPKLLLASEWGYAMFVFFAGLYYISVFIFGLPNMIPPQPAPLEQVFSLVILLRESVLCINIFLQNYSKGMWYKIKTKYEQLTRKLKLA